MELSELNELLNTLEIPVAYSHFKDLAQTPFLVYYVQNEDIRGADNKNMLSEKNIRIELYSDLKNIELEEQIEKIDNIKLEKDKQLDKIQKDIEDAMNELEQIKNNQPKEEDENGK